MIADAGDKLYLVRQFDQIIIGARCECLTLDERILFGRQHDNRSFGSYWVRPEQLQKVKAVDRRHHEVLEYNRGLDLNRRVNSIDRILTVMKVDIGQIR